MFNSSTRIAKFRIFVLLLYFNGLYTYIIILMIVCFSIGILNFVHSL